MNQGGGSRAKEDPRSLSSIRLDKPDRNCSRDKHSISAWPTYPCSIRFLILGAPANARACGPHHPRHPTFPQIKHPPLITTVLMPLSILFSSPFLSSFFYSIFLFSLLLSSPQPFTPASMSNNTTFPTPHYPPYGYSTSDLLPRTHHGIKNESSDVETDTSYGTTDSVLGTHHSGQDFHRPNTLSGSTSWEITTPPIPGVTSPSSHEVLGGADVLDAAPDTYPVGPHTPVISSHFHATP